VSIAIFTVTASIHIPASLHERIKAAAAGLLNHIQHNAVLGGRHCMRCI